MKIKLLSLLLVLSVFRVSAQSHKNEIGLQTDNDSYLASGSDRYYTNGIFIYYRHALNVAKDSKLANKVLGFEAGQKMFNPQSGYIPDQRYVDRPFAAYLYGGATLNLLYKDESALKFGAQVGIIGPGALGKQAQDFIHNTFGFYPPNGWQYQIRNEAQLNLSAEYNKLLARGNGADVSFSGYANLGNGFTGLGVGPLVRLGAFNQLFNSVTTQSTAIASQANGLLHKSEIFFYEKPQLQVIGYDATIQGGLLTGSDPTGMEVTSSVNHVIFSNEAGVAYSGSRFVVNAAVILHTRDAKEMVHSTHQWGAITALYRFN